MRERGREEWEGREGEREVGSEREERKKKGEGGTKRKWETGEWQREMKGYAHKESVHEGLQPSGSG